MATASDSIDVDALIKLRGNDAKALARAADAPELYMIFPSENRGHRECRCTKRTRSLVCKSRKAHELVTTGHAETSGIPCAMVLTAYSALSLVTGLCCHHPRAMRSIVAS